MKINFADPILFICIGVMIMCLAFLPWAISKFRKIGATDKDEDALPADTEPASDELGIPPLEPSRSRFQPADDEDDDNPFETPKPKAATAPTPPAFTPAAKSTPAAAPASAAYFAPPSASPAAVSPAATKEVADRLEMMNQRLSEMQAVLTKQTGGSPAPAGSVGQGFSTETVDKLMKIIGNVVMQVDILQKSLSVTKPAAPAQAALPAAAARPAVPAVTGFPRPVTPPPAASAKPGTPPPQTPK
jgi:hypothetical protein